MKGIMTNVQNLGRTLMLPIAVLPVAALLLRFGQPDLLNIPFVAAAGAAIFSNLGLLFAIGVAVGFAKENNGAAGLAGAVCYFVATSGARALIDTPPEAFAQVASEAGRALAGAAYLDREIAKLSVPIGILSGIASGVFYNRFHTIKVPEFLAFFGGRRFVPIAAGCFGVVIAAVFGFGWSHIEGAIDALSRTVVASGEIGLFVYGVLNRILIVTGLHHILNNVAWFLIGEYGGVTGDLNRFFAGDPSAGAFMAGFFPVMMFGLPAACLAMYHAAPPERRAQVGGMYLSLGLTSLLTGVTEPIEFTFMFLAPLLYAVHAVLTGLSMVVMDVLGVKLGFGFSAGLIDYVLNFNKSTRPLLLLPVGLVYAALYYGMFRLCIAVFNLKTPGRDDVVADSVANASGGAGEKARSFVEAFGGVQNLVSVDACTTRLRLVVHHQDSIDEARLKALGARGIIRPSATTAQVVLGPIADQTASEINAFLDTVVGEPTASETSHIAPANAPADSGAEITPAVAALAEKIVEAVGGGRNISDIKALSSRLALKLKDGDAVAEAALTAVGVRAVARPSADRLHIIYGPEAQAAGKAIRALLTTATA